MAEDTVCVMAALGMRKAHVLGYSMGGAIAQELVLRYPNKIDKLILACTTGQLARYQINIFEPLRFIRERDSTGRVAARNQLFMTMTREFLKLKAGMHMMVEMLLKPPFVQPMQAFSRQIDANTTFDVLDRLGSVKVPVCVLAGSQDMLTPPWVAKELADAIPGARFQILEDGAHALLFEIPEAFNRAVLNFLQA